MRSDSTSPAQTSSGAVTGLDSGQTLEPSDSYFCCVYDYIYFKWRDLEELGYI